MITAGLAPANGHRSDVVYYSKPPPNLSVQGRPLPVNSGTAQSLRADCTNSLFPYEPPLRKLFRTDGRIARHPCYPQEATLRRSSCPPLQKEACRFLPHRIKSRILMVFLLLLTCAFGTQGSNAFQENFRCFPRPLLLSESIFRT